MENITKVASGEYTVYFLTDQGNLYDYVWNQAALASIPTLVIKNKVSSAAGGLHNGLAIDISGSVWTYGDNTYGQRGNNTTGGDGTPLQVPKDSTGNVFSNLSQVVGWYSTNIARKADGTVWYWGQDYLNLFGKNVLVPTALVIPTGVSIAKIIAQSPLLGLDTNGGVWEWRTGNKTPVQISLPGKATDIAGCANGVSFAVVNGQPYGWGSAFSQWGLPSANPSALNSLWKINGTITNIVGNDNTLHYIDSNGDLWGVGDNQMGEVGNGDETNFSVVTPPNALYAWNWTRYLRMVKTPVHIAVGIKFKQICTENSDVFYVYAQDINGNWYSWGRNKGYVLGNGVGLTGDMASTYPNIADVPKPTLVTPLITPIVIIPTFAAAQAIYTKNTGYGGSTTTTTTSSTTTSTTTKATTSTTTTSTTTKAPAIPYIILYTDGTWIKQ